MKFRSFTYKRNKTFYIKKLLLLGVLLSTSTLFGCKKDISSSNSAVSPTESATPTLTPEVSLDPTPTIDPIPFDVAVDWNGEFRRYNNLGDDNGLIILAQGDSNSFEFIINAHYKLNIGQLFGIARIEGNTATFADDNGFTLTFTMNDGELLIEESGDNTYAGANVHFDGTYILDEDGQSNNEMITVGQATELLKTLTMEQTGLPAEITEYTLLPDDILLMVKEDTLCYSIGAYADLGERFTLMNSYYVATNGSKIFKYDITVNDDVEIYSEE